MVLVVVMVVVVVTGVVGHRKHHQGRVHTFDHALAGGGALGVGV